jgi:uncharacterized protein
MTRQVERTLFTPHEKDRTVNVLKLLLVGLVTVSATTIGRAAEPELKGTPAELQRFLRTATHSVTLVGHAKQTVQADVGHVTVIVRIQAKDLTGAITANGQRREALTQSLQSKGIDSKAIRAAKFSTSPQFGWFGKTPSSYEVVNRMTVDVSDERQLTIVTAAAAESPDLSIGAIVFEYSKQQELEEQVRRAAFDDALAKKSFYEQRLSANLKPTEFSFSDFSARSTPGALALEEVVVTANRRSASELAPSVSAPFAPPSFGEKEYEVTANISFAIDAIAASH